jgi:hypothetical protein
MVYRDKSVRCPSPREHGDTGSEAFDCSFNLVIVFGVTETYEISRNLVALCTDRYDNRVSTGYMPLMDREIVLRMAPKRGAILYSPHGDRVLGRWVARRVPRECYRGTGGSERYRDKVEILPGHEAL